MKKIFFLILLTISLNAYAQLGGITIPSGHASNVQDIKIDATGKFLFSSDYEHVVMWEIKTGTQLYTFPAYENISEFAISPDGNQIVMISEHYTTSYSTLNGKMLWQNRELGFLKSTIFSNDGAVILGMTSYGSSNNDNVVRFIESKSGKELQKITYDGTSLGVTKFYKIDDQQIALASIGSYIILNNDFKVTSVNIIPKDGIVKSYLPGRKQFLITYKNPNGYSNFVYGLISIKGENLIAIKSEDQYKSLGAVIPSTSGDSFMAIRTLEETNIHEAWLFNQVGPTKTKLPWRFNGKEMIIGGLINGVTGKVYLKGGREIVELDMKTGKEGQLFRREVASLGSESFTSMEYNSINGRLNIMTEDSLYKSIDLLRMIPYRHTNTSTHIDMIAFSPGGDTIAVFNESKSYLKNVVTGKKILTSIPGAKGASSIDYKWFFFSKNGSKVFFVTFDVPTQKFSLKCYNLITKLLRTIIVSDDFGDFTIHPDKTIIAYKVGSNLDYTIKVLNIETGKLLLNLPLKDKGIGPLFLSFDKKQILLANKTFGFKYYNIADGKLIVQPNSGELKNGFPATSTMNANPNLSKVFAGTNDGFISAYDVNGTSIYYNQIHTGGVGAILFSPNNKFMFIVSDQTINVLRVADGTSLGTLYLFNDGNDYVFVDKEGRFDGSNGGIKRLYYIKNREKIALDLVYEKFFTPNLYQRLLNGEVFDPIDINIKLAPNVKIAYAEIARNLNVAEDGIPTYQNKTGVAEITVTATSADDNIEEIRLFHNGKIVNLATRGLFVADNAVGGTNTKKYTLNLLPGLNNLRAVALNTQRTESKPDEILVNFSEIGTPTVTPIPNNSNAIISQVDKKATLHLIVVGINKYQNDKMSLNYALADATAFKDEAEIGAKTIISNTKTYFVTDEKANKDGIIQAFNEVQKSAKPEDVFVFYYAGHGVISQKNKEFYLVPTDVTDLHNVDEALAQKGIPSKLLQQYAIDIAAQKQVFILDACQSAGAFEAMLAADGNQQKSLAVVAKSTGTHWIAASGSQQFANEFSALGHGAFTYVLLQALKGEAASNKMITVNGLKSYLQLGVPALMKKYNGSTQYPASYGFGNDFPVEVMK